jgi:1-acyl-sn-glycerol-3-phosphate acyltransferase
MMQRLEPGRVGNRHHFLMSSLKKSAWLALNAIQLLITLLWSIFWIIIALIIRVVTGRAHVPLRMAAWIWSPFLIYGSLSRFTVQGQERVDFSRPHVFVANHSSMIDICALFLAIPVPLRFVLKAELGAVPLLGWYTRAMDMVLIKRGGARDTARQLRRAVDIVGRGHSLAAFPEGTRSTSGPLRRFKSGAFKVAIAAGVPVIPVAIEGSGHVMPPGGFNIRPGHIRVCFGNPMETGDLQASDAQQLADHARRAIEEMRLQ